MQAILSREVSAAHATVYGNEADNEMWKEQGLVGSFVRLLYEQRGCFPFYMIMLASVCGVASATPLQAYLFAQVINIFTLPPEDLLNRAAFWSLMRLVLALAIGAFYFVMGFVSVNLQYFICATYREQYFSALIR